MIGKRIYGLILLVVLGGCVSIGTFEREKRRAHGLEQQNRELQKSVDSLTESLAEKESTLSDLEGTQKDLESELKEEIEKGSVGITASGQTLSVTVDNKLLFGSGRSDLQASGEIVVKKVSNVLKGVKDHLIHVEGHTDNIPISGSLKSRYPSNWELSSARAAAVARSLEKEGVDAKLLTVIGCADKKPISDNSTPEGRKKNRRVEILLVPVPPK